MLCAEIGTKYIILILSINHIGDAAKAIFMCKAMCLFFFLFLNKIKYFKKENIARVSNIHLINITSLPGIYYTMAVIGPAVGYVLGGQLLLFYTDMFSVDATE